MNYEEVHAGFIQHHLTRRTGERQGRLERGHLHGEQLFARQVWWELMRSFDHLHPEYEVLDWRGRSYFADFAWLPGYTKLLIEIKGFSKHVRDMDRQSYCRELNREAFLLGLGYPVVSFAYDDVEQRPELCMHLLRSIMSRFQTAEAPVTRLKLAEKELIRLAIQLARPIRPKDVELHFEINHRTAVALLRKLCEKGWFVHLVRGKGERMVCFELTHRAFEFIR
ncbi:hypothetical protein [Paenibacillus koleovorans]|uniref:hypothetical protein n=1 Tax=Paenibacillus koleovorans TaxID=121608 RepID=UPI000FD98C85|nr:hypothetical protein [Paenibacillus koleovorans]